MMKKTFSRLLMICLTLLTLSACEMETSDNGKLDGFWQLTAIDSLANGRSGDMRHSGIYWGVQLKLLQVKNLRKNESFMFRFSMDDDTLRLCNPIRDIRQRAGEVQDEHVMNPQELKAIGFAHLEEAFKVLQLTGNHMTLENDHFRMYFRKY